MTSPGWRTPGAVSDVNPGGSGGGGPASGGGPGGVFRGHRERLERVTAVEGVPDIPPEVPELIGQRRQEAARRPIDQGHVDVGDPACAHRTSRRTCCRSPGRDRRSSTRGWSQGEPLHARFDRLPVGAAWQSFCCTMLLAASWLTTCRIGVCCRPPAVHDGCHGVDPRGSVVVGGPADEDPTGRRSGVPRRARACRSTVGRPNRRRRCHPVTRCASG